MADASEVIRRPLVTEKTHQLMERNQYTFEVAPSANKVEIRQAVEKLFHVRVKDVNTVRVRGKMRRMGRFVGRRSDRKKAVVTLVEGDRIELFEGI